MRVYVPYPPRAPSPGRVPVPCPCHGVASPTSSGGAPHRQGCMIITNQMTKKASSRLVRPPYPTSYLRPPPPPRKSYLFDVLEEGKREHAASSAAIEAEDPQPLLADHLRPPLVRAQGRETLVGEELGVGEPRAHSPKNALRISFICVILQTNGMDDYFGLEQR